MFCAPNRLNKFSETCFKFSFILRLANLQWLFNRPLSWRVLKSWCGTQNKDFGAVSQTDLTRVKFHRFCGAGLSKYRPEMARWFNCHFFNFLIVLMYIYSTSIDAEAVKTNRSSIVNITSGNPWRHSISGLPVSPLAT